MRFLRPVVLSTLVVAVLIAMTLTAAPPASAATGGPASTDVVPMGGCIAHFFCGTVINHTNRFIKVCLAWNAPGKDEAYQPTAHCQRGKIGYVKPHTTWGWPQVVDIDAFCTPRGMIYRGSWFVHTATWRHIQSGWWKFSTLTTVVIDSASPPRTLHSGISSVVSEVDPGRTAIMSIPKTASRPPDDPHQNC